MIDGAIDESGDACREGRFGVTRRDERDSADRPLPKLVHGKIDLRRGR